LRSSEPDNGLIWAVHEELNEFDTDVAMQRENRPLRAGRIVATVEAALFADFAVKLRELGLPHQASHYDELAERREIQSTGKGRD
jgi:hypothetical protein